METLGQYLKRERELRNITVDELATDTKISHHWIFSMEEDKWSEMPAHVYTQGFLRLYADYIGVGYDDIRLRFDELGDVSKEKGMKSVPPQMQDANDEKQFSYGWLVAVVIAIILIATVFVTYRF